MSSSKSYRQDNTENAFLLSVTIIVYVCSFQLRIVFMFCVQTGAGRNGVEPSGRLRRCACTSHRFGSDIETIHMVGMQ